MNWSFTAHCRTERKLLKVHKCNTKTISDNNYVPHNRPTECIHFNKTNRNSVQEHKRQTLLTKTYQRSKETNKQEITKTLQRNCILGYATMQETHMCTSGGRGFKKESILHNALQGWKQAYKKDPHRRSSSAGSDNQIPKVHQRNTKKSSDNNYMPHNQLPKNIDLNKRHKDSIQECNRQILLIKRIDHKRRIADRKKKQQTENLQRNCMLNFALT